MWGRPNRTADRERGDVELGTVETDVDATHRLTGERTRLCGTLRNFNTIEEFRDCDKAKLLDDLGKQVRPEPSPTTPGTCRLMECPLQIWDRATSAAAEDAPPTLESLNPFLLITFADLKKYRYYYWCGFPAVAQKPGWAVVEAWTAMELSEVVRGDEDWHCLVPGDPY